MDLRANHRENTTKRFDVARQQQCQHADTYSGVSKCNARLPVAIQSTLERATNDCSRSDALDRVVFYPLEYNQRRMASDGETAAAPSP
jgi:hypothetical protein